MSVIYPFNATTNGTLSLSDLIDGEWYRTELVFDFLYIGDDFANDYIVDWMELVWSGYFALFFGTLGSQLKRCSQFVYQLRVFEFYGIFIGIRRNPAFVDAVMFERFLRCILSAGLAAIIALMIKAEEVVELYTIVTMGSGHLINLLDPYLRGEGDCAGIGPPTEDFPYGVWVDCGNWKLAYAVTWINSLWVYLVVGISLIGMKSIKKKFPCIRKLEKHSGYVAVAMTATNSATTFLTCLRRRTKIHNEYFDVFVQYSYYILLGSFYVVQVLIDCIMKCRKKHLEQKSSMSLSEISLNVRSKTWRVQTYCYAAVKMVSMIFWGLAMPLYWTDQALKWIIQKIIKINVKRLAKEDKRSQRSQREITVEEYWKIVNEGHNNKSTDVEMVADNKSTDVEMVAGGTSSAKPKSASSASGLTKLGDIALNGGAQEESEDDDEGEAEL